MGVFGQGEIERNPMKTCEFKRHVKALRDYSVTVTQASTIAEEMESQRMRITELLNKLYPPKHKKSLKSSDFMSAK